VTKKYVIELKIYSGIVYNYMFAVRNILKSFHAKFIFLLAILSLAITTIKYLSLKVFVVQTFLFIYLIFSVDCNIYGKCYSSVYITQFFAILITTFLICDYLGIFKPYKQAIRRLFKLYENSNNSGLNDSLKQIIFPKEEEISQMYKNRKFPKLINKKFKHQNSVSEIQEIEEMSHEDITKLNNNINNLL
jgi:K+-sensing histidine kinase KdpD